MSRSIDAQRNAKNIIIVKAITVYSHILCLAHRDWFFMIVWCTSRKVFQTVQGKKLFGVKKEKRDFKR